MTVPTPSSHNPDHSGSSPAHGGPYDGPYDGQGAPLDAYHAGPAGEYGTGLPPGAVRERVLREGRDALLFGLGVAVPGIVLGLLWLWLAPRVPLYTDGKAVYLKDPEGEEAIGADGTFVLLALGLGLLTGAIVFLVRRRGGVGVVTGLVFGALAGSLLAWGIGTWFGPESDMVAAAKAAGAGATFDSPLELSAKGALLVWPLLAVLVHLALTGMFGPRDPEPPLAPSGPPAAERPAAGPSSAGPSSAEGPAGW